MCVHVTPMPVPQRGYSMYTRENVAAGSKPSCMHRLNITAGRIITRILWSNYYYTMCIIKYVY